MASYSARLVAQRIAERAQELRYGIQTAGLIRREALGYDDPDALQYNPVFYAPLKRLLAAVAPHPEKDVLVDWGSGMGRVLTLASAYPYREVIGVELSAPLCAVAEQNLQRARIKKICGKVTVTNANALEFAIPPAASVMFFANPFRGELLKNVVRRIRDSWLAHPRPMVFLVFNHRNFVQDSCSSDWLRREWDRQEFPHASSCVIRTFE